MGRARQEDCRQNAREEGVRVISQLKRAYNEAQEENHLQQDADEDVLVDLDGRAKDKVDTF